MAITELKPYLSNIAEKLKSLLGITDKINAQDFTEKIDEVYEAGKQAQYDEFWDMFQDNGNRTKYGSAFHKDNGWIDGVYRPKYDIKPVGDWGYACANMYFQSLLTDIYANDSINVDFSGGTGTAYQTFYGAGQITHLKTIDLSGCTKWNNFFAYCIELKTIEKLIFPEDGSCVWQNNSCMEYCLKLENLTIEGIIPNTAFIGHSPLTNDSAKSVINALMDYSGTDKEFAYTLTLKSTVKDALIAEGNTAPNGLTWDEYVTTVKGWNW